ncbi:MAG: patatin-like phospholipase family protein [Proteobacteria bacterium]|nr:patatin-like phospholipase family protein [Pseudomonadota bacterium]
MIYDSKENSSDPTDREDLRDLLLRVRKHLSNTPIFPIEPERSTALVLSGGGGKGAYEAGAILALWDSGFRDFSAIAGTSVGALNAILFKRLLQTRDRKIVLKTWSNLSFHHVLKLNPWMMLKIALYLPITINALQRFPTTTNILGDSISIGLPKLSSLLMDVLKLLATSVLPFCIGIVGVVLLRFGLSHLLESIGIATSKTISIFVLLLFLVPMCSKLLSQRMSLADNTPLRDIVKNIFHPNLVEGDPEIICTLAVKPSARNVSGFPHYPTLAKVKNTEDVIELLIQSAALPEIFRMKKIFGNKCVDGGVQDNVPIYGLYPIQPKRVIVIYLEYAYHLMLNESEKCNIGRVINDRQTVWDQNAALRIYENNRLADIAHRRMEKWEGPRRDWFAKTDLLPIIPSAHLGNIVTGTLNFSAKKSRVLIALGYENTLSALLSWEPQDVWA